MRFFFLTLQEDRKMQIYLLNHCFAEDVCPFFGRPTFDPFSCWDIPRYQWYWGVTVSWFPLWKLKGGQPFSPYSLHPGCCTWPAGQSYQGSEAACVTQEERVVRTQLGQQSLSVALARATSWPACFCYVACTVSLVHVHFPSPPSHSPTGLYDPHITFQNILLFA